MFGRIGLPHGDMRHETCVGVAPLLVTYMYFYIHTMICIQGSEEQSEIPSLFG